MASHTVGGTKQVSVLPTLRAVVCVAQNTRLILVLLDLPHPKNVATVIRDSSCSEYPFVLRSSLIRDLGIVTVAELAVLVGFDLKIQASASLDAS